MQSEAFSNAQPLMNGQADGMKQSKHGAGEDPLQHSEHSSSGSSEAADRGEAEVHVGDQELLGQQTLDFWLNLCICHTLIVEQDDNGGPCVYQVQRLPCRISVSLHEGSICAFPRHCLFSNHPQACNETANTLSTQAASPLCPAVCADWHTRSFCSDLSP